MKKIISLILAACLLLALAATASADSAMFVLYSMEKPDGESFTVEDSDNFPFYVLSLNSDDNSVVLYYDDQEPLGGIYELGEIVESEDGDIRPVTFTFDNGDVLEMYADLSTGYLVWIDSDEWTNVLLPKSDYPDGDAVQLKVDRLNGMGTYVVTSITRPDGTVETPEDSDSFPKLSVTFCKDPTICFVRSELDEYEYEYTAEGDEEADTIVITLTAPELPTLTITGSYSGSTLFLESESDGIATLTLAN